MQPTPRDQRPACPQCNRPFSPGRETCMWCGAPLQQVQLPTQIYDCPVCEGTLQPQQGQGWSVHICDKCNGIWMNAFMMQRLEKIHQETQTKPNPDINKSQKPDTEEKPEFNFQYRQCPQCHQIMRRASYKVSGVILDECMGHGTWFDANEFEKVLTYLKTGGIQKYQKYKKQQNAEKNKPRYMTNNDYKHHRSGGISYFGGFYKF